MNESSKQVLDNLIGYICFYEQDGKMPERCNNGIFPACNGFGCGCYAILRETRDRFEKLDEIKKIVGGGNNDN